MTIRLGWIRNIRFHTARTPAAFTVACAFGLMAPSALATPEGGTFVTNPTWGQILQSGPAGQTLTNVFLPGVAIDPSNRHIIHWTSLDLGTQETLNFSGAAGYSVMNRISGLGTATSINGTLNAMTGNVFIVNSAGVVFGQNAMINASGLYAAAANWSDGDAMHTDFLAGAPLTFDLTGDVEFGGTLNASNGVALLGQHVRNTGDISGRYVVMAAGDRCVVEDLGSRFSVMIDGQVMDDLVNGPVAGTVNADITTGDPGIHNSGTVTATDNGSVSLLVGDLLGLSILHDGEIHASGGDVDLLAAGGAIWTSTNNAEVADAGLISVSDNTQAGTIDISAAAIVLDGMTEANGDSGDVSIQGFFNVVMSDGAAVTADGGSTSADGGSILLRAAVGTVWAETGTGLSAKGGLFGGDGGRIEVDGLSVALQAGTKLSAVSGDSGQLVINSFGSVVVDATGDALVLVDETSLSTSILAIGEMGRIGAASGETLSSVDGHLSLTSTNPLRIEASLLGLHETASFASSEIQVAIADTDQRIDATTLSFSGDMSLESSVTLSGDDALALMDGNVSGDSTTAITLLSGGSMDLEGDLGAADSKLASVYMETGHTLTMVGGRGRAGQYIHASGDVHIGGSNAGPVAITASEALVVQADGDISIGAVGGELDVTAHNNIDVEAAGTLTNHAKFDVGGSLRFAGGDVLNAADVSTEQGITMQALTGELQIDGVLDTVMDINLASASTLTNDVSMTSEQGSIRLESYQSDVVSLASLSAADLVLLQADNGAVFSMADVQATDVTISAASGVEISGNVAAASSFNAIASAGNIAVSGDTIEGDTLSLTALAGSIDATSSFIGQSVDIDAANNLTLTGDVTAATSALAGAGGELTLTAGNGPLVVTGDLVGTTISLTSTAGAIDATSNMSATTIGVDAGTDLTIAGNITSADALTLNATDALVVNGDLAGTTILLTSTAGEIDATSNMSATTIGVDAGTDLTIAGNITSADALTLNATDALVVNGDLAGTTILLTSTAGEIDATSNMTATTISFDAGTDLTLAGDITAVDTLTLDATDALDYLGNATSQGDVILTGQSITMNSGSLNGAAVEVTSPGAVALTGDVTSDTTISVDAGTDLTLAGDITAVDTLTLNATDALDYSGNATSQGDVTLTAGNGPLVVNGDLDGTTILLTSTAGEIDATSNMSATTIGVDAGTDLTLAGDITAVDALTLNATDALVVNGDLDGTTILLTSTAGEIDATSNMTATTISFDAGTDLTLAGDITAVDTLTLDATDALDYLGNATSQGDVILTGQSITMNSGSLNGAAVEVTSPGAVALTGDVTSDTTISVDAGTDLTLAGDITAVDTLTLDATDALDYLGNATSQGDVILTGQSITMNSGSLNGAAVEVTSPGAVALTGDVTSDTTISVDAGTDLTLAGDITAVDTLTLNATDALDYSGNATSQGDVTLTAGNGPLVVNGDLDGTTILLTSTAGEIDATSNMTATTISFDAGTDLTLAGDITAVDTLTLDATDALDYLGNATSQGDVILTGQSITMNSGSLNGAAVEVTSPGAVALTGDVTSDTTISVDAGTDLTLAGDITAVDTLTLNATDALDYSGNATSQGDVTLTAGNGPLVVNGDLDGTTILLTSTAGEIDATSNMTATTISFDAGTDLTLAGDITAVDTLTLDATDALDYSGNATSQGDVILTGQSITMNSGSLNGAAVEVTSPGAVALTGDVTSATTISVDAGTDLTLAGDITAVDTLTLNATDALDYSGNATSQGDVTLTAGNGPLVVNGDLDGTTILLTSTAGEIDATSNMSATTISFDAGTDLTLAGDITAVDTLTLDATDALDYSGNATSQGDVILTGQSITMNSGSLNGAAVEVTSPGAVALTGEINTAGDLKVTSTSGTVALDVAAAIDGDILVTAEHDVALAGEFSASAIEALSAQGDVTQSGSMVATGEVAVNANAGSIALAGDLTGGNVFLDAASVQLSGGSIQSTVGGIEVLSDELLASGTVHLESAADLTLAAEQGAGRMRVDGANLRMVAAGDLSLLATIDGAGGVLNASAVDTLSLGGNVGGVEAVESLNLTGGTLRLGTSRDGVIWNLSEINARGDIGLYTSNPTLSSELPSIFGFGPSLSVRSGEGNITFGGNHAVSYLGDVVLDAARTLAIGDFTTLGDLTLRGETIEVHRRSPVMLMSPGGSSESMQTSVVSGGLMTIDGDVQFVGSTGNNPLFGSVEGGSGIPGLNRAPVDPFGKNDIRIGVGGMAQPTLQSLTAIAPSGDDDSIAAESQLGEIVVQLSGNEDIRTLAVLADLGIELIDAAEVAQSTHHLTAAAEFVNDMSDRGSTMADPTSGLVKITRSRLNDRFVQAAVADYAAALDAATVAGSLESAGLTVREARLEWEAQPGEKTDYRQWLAEGGDPIRERAARILADLDAVYRDLRLAGLTRAEVAASRRFVSAKLAG